jgi:LPXTG-motif cell wall-anchored protein
MLLPTAETETETETEELADTGADSGVIALVVLALMMLIGGSVLVNRVNN